jgi:hypothetical protein
MLRRKENHDQKIPPQSLTGIQCQSGFCCSEGKSDASAAIDHCVSNVLVCVPDVTYASIRESAGTGTTASARTALAGRRLHAG